MVNQVSVSGFGQNATPLHRTDPGSRYEYGQGPL